MKVRKYKMHYETISCFSCRSKRAKFYSGHVHSDTNIKRWALAGWCSDACSTMSQEKCPTMETGCFGSVRLRGFKLVEP